MNNQLTNETCILKNKRKKNKQRAMMMNMLIKQTPHSEYIKVLGFKLIINKTRKSDDLANSFVNYKERSPRVFLIVSYYTQLQVPV